MAYLQSTSILVPNNAGETEVILKPSIKKGSAGLQVHDHKTDFAHKATKNFIKGSLTHFHYAVLS